MFNIILFLEFAFFVCIVSSPPILFEYEFLLFFLDCLFFDPDNELSIVEAIHSGLENDDLAFNIKQMTIGLFVGAIKY